MRRIYRLSCGSELLRQFSLTSPLNTVTMVGWLVMKWEPADPYFLVPWVGAVVSMIVLEALIFWNGMIRVYITSVQLGIKHRVLAALCGWIPFVNLWYLQKIIRITTEEEEFETEKWELDAVRAESALCGTKYPLLMVHGGGLDSRAAMVAVTDLTESACLKRNESTRPLGLAVYPAGARRQAGDIPNGVPSGDAVFLCRGGAGQRFAGKISFWTGRGTGRSSRFFIA